MKQMNVHELRTEIDDIFGTKFVYVWIDGERYPVIGVDRSFLREGFVELNVHAAQPYHPTPEEAAFMTAYLRNVAQASDTEVLFFLEHKTNESVVIKDGYHWWAGVEDAWLMWQDAKKFTQGESK